MSRFVKRALSQYEGEKRMWDKLESIAEGKLAPRIRPEPVTSYLCTICKTQKRNFRLLRTHIRGMGERIKGMRGHYIKACEACAAAVERPVEQARQASGEPA